MRRAPMRDSTYACVHLGELAGCNPDSVVRPLGSCKETLRKGGNRASSDQQWPVVTLNTSTLKG